MIEVITPLDLRDASAQEIADEYSRRRERLGRVARRFSCLEAIEDSLRDRLAQATRVGLEREMIIAVEGLHDLDAITPHDRLTHEWGEVSDKIAALSIREARYHARTDTPYGKPSTSHLEWMTLFEAFDGDIPPDSTSYITDDILKSTATIRRDLNPLLEQSLIYESIYEPWPLIPGMAEVLRRPKHKFIDLRRITSEHLGVTNRKQPSSPNPRRQRNQGESLINKGDRSRAVINLLIDNPDKYFTYAEITDIIYANEPSAATDYDARVASIFDTNLTIRKNGHTKSGIFAQALGQKWVIVEGKKVKLDQASGRPLNRSKPELCFKVERRADVA